MVERLISTGDDLIIPDWVVVPAGNLSGLDQAIDARLAFSAATPAMTDVGPLINSELSALAATGGRLQLRPGTLNVGTSIQIPSGCELVGLGARVTQLFTATDMPAIAFRGGQCQAVRNLKIQNAITGARTTYDIDITNPTKIVLEDVEVANTPTSSGLGGVRLLGVTPLTGENHFMPQLSRVWIRSGRLRIEQVSDGHFTDGYVWATNRSGGGAIEMANISDGWTFTNVDYIPPTGDGGGYSLQNTNNLEVVGGYCDGSYDAVMTGYGVKAVDSGRIFFTAHRFYNLGRSGIHFTNTHGTSFGQCGFFNCNKADASYPDIDLYDSDFNTFEGNVHTCYKPRTNGGLLYREDGSSTSNSVDNNAFDQSLGMTYASPYMQGALTTFGRRNRPGPYWARPAGTPNCIVPAASLYPPPGAAVAWPAPAAAIFHRFTVEVGGVYRYVKFRCSVGSGNLQAAVVALSGAGLGTYTRVMNSGIIPAVGGVDHALDLGSTYLNPGEYAIALWCDNTAATFWHGITPALTATKMAGKITSGLGSGIPSSGTITWEGDRYVSGLSLSHTT